MADEKSNGGAAPGDGEDAADLGGPPLIIRAQYIKDLSFENPNAPAVLADLNEPPQIEVSVNVGGERHGDSDYEVTLTINAEAKAGDQTAFLIELVYSGYLTVQGVSEEHIQPLVMIEGPRLLFPFARNVIADITREGGYPPLFLQPMDFASLFQQEGQS